MKLRITWLDRERPSAELPVGWDPHGVLADVQLETTPRIYRCGFRGRDEVALNDALGEEIQARIVDGHCDGSKQIHDACDAVAGADYQGTIAWHLFGETNAERRFLVRYGCKPSTQTNPLEWIEHPKGGVANAHWYDTPVIDVRGVRGKIRLWPSAHVVRNKWKPFRYGKVQAYDVAFYPEDERADVNKLAAAPLRLEHAKRAAELWLEKRPFTSDDGKIVDVFPAGHSTPTRGHESNPQDRLAGRLAAGRSR